MMPSRPTSANTSSASSPASTRPARWPSPPAQDIVHSNTSARDEATRLAALRLDACIFNVPVFPFPNYAVIAAQMLDRTPLLLLGPHDPRYPGLTGLLAVGGALSQNRRPP